MKLTIEQIAKVEAVMHTLNYGITKGWVNPAASFDACISVLKDAKKLEGKSA